jgi:hypothetical protein
VSGPIHPLLGRIRELRRLREQHTPLAHEILDDHHAHALSDQTVYLITGPQRWARIGAHEHHAHLLGQRGYLAVTGRTPVLGLAEHLALLDDHGRGGLHRAETLRDTAHLAAPVVAVLLAVCVRGGLVRWDTGETVHDAATRLALDAGHRFLDLPNPALPCPLDIYADVADELSLVDWPARDYAAAYLADRDVIHGALAAQDIAWGGPVLTAQEAADRARVAYSTWRAYVSREEAPAADQDGRWRASTVDAWRLTRSAETQLGWWSSTPAPAAAGAR